MLHNATLDGLSALRLPAMVRGLLEQREHPTTRRSASRNASPCSSTVSSPNAPTVACSGC